MVMLLRPSVSQKLPWRKGRSAVIISIAVLSLLEASSLNFLAEVAQTGVSMLGAVQIIFVLPEKSARETSFRSPLVS